MPLVTFYTWHGDFALGGPKPSKPVSIDPHEVSDVEDYCGDIKPGSVITLKNKKTYLVEGKHDWIVAVIDAARREK